MALRRIVEICIVTHYFGVAVQQQQFALFFSVPRLAGLVGEFIVIELLGRAGRMTAGGFEQTFQIAGADKDLIFFLKKSSTQRYYYEKRSRTFLVQDG